MMRSIIFMVALFSATPAFACPMADAAAFEKAAIAVQQSEGAKATFKLDGLTCGSCSDKVSTELKTIDGIILAAVDYQSGRVEVAYDNTKTDVKKIEIVLEKTGYKIVEKPKI
jgi:copper chaperone CopZ